MIASGLRLHHLRLLGARPSCCPPPRALAAVRAQKLQLPKKKRRLDEVCLERFQQYSRTYIQSWILQGQKLEAAIKEFGVDCDGKVALDSGLSTGGFTDCLLQHGVLRVYGVDVDYGQVMPVVVKVMKMDSILITLIKPQFEAHRSQVGGGGIVRDPLVRKEVLDRIISGVEQFGFCNKGWIESPIKGAEGNTEFLACFHRIPMPEPQAEEVAEAT